jgi:NTE family protein
MLRTDIHDDYRPTPLTAILRKQFACESEERIAMLEAGADYVSLASGEILFRQGDAGDELFFLLSGRLRAMARAADDTVRALGEIGRGESVGELSLFTGGVRSASVVALRDSVVARVPRLLIERVISRSPELALSLTRLVIERYRQKQEPRNCVPAIVCVLPISRGVDALGFASSLRDRWPTDAGSVAVFDAAQIAERFGDGVVGRPWWSRGPVGRFIADAEEENAATCLVADFEDSDWTRLCLQHADEVVLLGDGAALPELSEAEAKLLGNEPITIARRTLVLLHDDGVKSPRHTAAWLQRRGRPRHFHIRPSLPSDVARMARILSGRATGLVLAGGGARGFAHVGVYRALEELGIPIDFVGGTSIGALMGTLIALDVRADVLGESVQEGFLRHPKGNITGDFNLLPLLSLIRGERSKDSLATSVRRHAGGEIDMEDSWKTFFSIASNFSAGREEVLTQGPLVRNVAASFAIPGALPPIVKDGQLLFDGGTFNNFPVDVMAGLGVGKVIGVDVSGDVGDRHDIEAVPGTFALLLDKLRPREQQRYRRLPTLPETMLMSSFITAMSRQREQRREADLLFRPPLPSMRLLDWHRFPDVVEAGYVHAVEVLSAMGDKGLADYRSSA